MNLKNRIWLSVACLLCLVFTKETSSSSFSLSDEDDKRIEAFMSKHDVPGLSIAVLQSGETVVAKGYGYANKKTKEKVTTTSRFRIASISKPITSVAIMKLYQEEKLHPSDSVFGEDGLFGNEYGIPQFDSEEAEITVQQLLTHTTGGWSNKSNDPMFQHKSYSHKKLITWVLDERPLEHEPGTHYAYSNFGYCVLGRIIEKLTQQSYPDYVKEHVLQPCGINSMEIAGNTRKDRLPNEVVYYGRKGENPYGMNVSRMDSHGGWIATAEDLVKFVSNTDFFNNQPCILEKSKVEFMVTPTPLNLGYAKGWSIWGWKEPVAVDIYKRINWFHNGSIPGTLSICVRARNGYYWAILINTRDKSGDKDSTLWHDLDRLGWQVID